MISALFVLSLVSSPSLAEEPEAPIAAAAEADEADETEQREGTVLTKDFLERIPAGESYQRVVFGAAYRMQQREREVERQPAMALDAANLGRVWTEDTLDRIGPGSLASREYALSFTPGAMVDGSGQLWLSGSPVHTIYLDGVALDVERVRR